LVHAPAARAFANAERAMSELVPREIRPDAPLSASAFMEAHYFLNDCFLSPDALLSRAPDLGHIPGIVVQARLDLLCPPRAAVRLVAEWPGARLVIVEAAGHSLGHSAIFEAVRAGIAELTG
jgi:proline iminopeptidase